MLGFTHLNQQGEVHMVDVASKDPTHRVARATGMLLLQESTLQGILEGTQRKGDVLAVARVAAIMAAKRTADLIPLCHPLSLTRVEVEFSPRVGEGAIDCTVQVETVGRTGVEMEAMGAVSVGLLTLYDMCKALDRGMRLTGIRVLEKSGGRSGDWHAP